MIIGAKASLRAIEESDAPLYHRWINDHETNTWRGLYHPTSACEASDWLKSLSQVQTDRLALVVQDEESNAIGLIGLRNICSRSRRAEIWIYLGEKSKWGCGYASDAIRTLCHYAFDEMNLFRIWLECDPTYLSAVKCYEKAGFVLEGTLRKSYYRRGEYRDSCIMGLLREDWYRKDQDQGSL